MPTFPPVEGLVSSLGSGPLALAGGHPVRVPVPGKSIEDLLADSVNYPGLGLNFFFDPARLGLNDGDTLPASNSMPFPDGQVRTMTSGGSTLPSGASTALIYHASHPDFGGRPTLENRKAQYGLWDAAAGFNGQNATFVLVAVNYSPIYMSASPSYIGWTSAFNGGSYSGLGATGPNWTISDQPSIKSFGPGPQVVGAGFPSIVVCKLTASTATTKFFVDGQDMGAAGNTLNAGTYGYTGSAGGMTLLGNFLSTSWAIGHVAYAAVLNQALSDADCKALTARLRWYFGLGRRRPQSNRPLVVIDGDSRMCGFTTYNTAATQLVGPAFRQFRGPRSNDDIREGGWVADVHSGSRGNAKDYVVPTLLTPGLDPALITWLGINDINSSLTYQNNLSVIPGAVATYCANAAADGFNHLIHCTEIDALPGSASPGYPNRTAANIDGFNNAIASVQTSGSATISSVAMATLTGSFVTATFTAANHGLQSGMRVTIAGFNTSTQQGTALNGTKTIANVVDANTFTVIYQGPTVATYSGLSGVTAAAAGGLWTNGDIDYYIPTHLDPTVGLIGSCRDVSAGMYAAGDKIHQSYKGSEAVARQMAAHYGLYRWERDGAYRHKFAAGTYGVNDQCTGVPAVFANVPLPSQGVAGGSGSGAGQSTKARPGTYRIDVEASGALHGGWQVIGSSGATAGNLVVPVTDPITGGTASATIPYNASVATMQAAVDSAYATARGAGYTNGDAQVVPVPGSGAALNTAGTTYAVVGRGGYKGHTLPVPSITSNVTGTAFVVAHLGSPATGADFYLRRVFLCNLAYDATGTPVLAVRTIAGASITDLDATLFPGSTVALGVASSLVTAGGSARGNQRQFLQLTLTGGASGSGAAYPQRIHWDVDLTISPHI